VLKSPTLDELSDTMSSLAIPKYGEWNGMTHMSYFMKLQKTQVVFLIGDAVKDKDLIA